MTNFIHAKPTDWEMLRDLNFKIYGNNPKFDPYLIPDFVYTEPSKKFFDDAISSEGGCCLLLWDDGELVGYTNGGPINVPYRKGKCFEVDNLGVIPDKKGRGYGKLLLNEISKWAKEQGYERLYLSCYSKNTEALGFYRKQGFEDLDIGLEMEI